MPSVFSQVELGEYITKVLGKVLSKEEIQKCLQTVEIIEPVAAMQIWQSTLAEPGIYIVIGGKVRLLDGADNLVATLKSGSSFGEATLFGENEFQPYAARSSTNLKLCYLKQGEIKSLISKYPEICDRLRKRAESWDLLMLCRQNSQLLGSKSTEATIQALSLFKSHSLKTSDEISFPKNAKLSVVRQGELINPEGKKLNPGIIWKSSLIEDSLWKATGTTVAYSLSNSDWNEALKYCPALKNFIESETPNESIAEQGNIQLKPLSERFHRSNNVIPFRSPTAKRNKKPEKQLLFPTPKVKVKHWWERFTQQYPFYAQQSASDCGAACLVMISRHWGKRLSVSRLRDLANINRNGASLQSLAAAAENIGFVTRPVRASFDRLVQQTLPLIAHWEGKHYIVVFEINPKQVIVCDPAIGQRVLTHKQFQAGWTGYALLLQPTVQFKETQEETSSIWQFFELLKPHTKVIFEIFVASLLLQVFGLITPIFTQLLLDRVILQGSNVTLTAISLGLIIFGLFQIVINGLRQYLLAHTANRVSVALLVGFIKHTFRLPLGYFESRYVGDIVSRIQENKKIQRFLTGETLSILLDLLTVCIYLAVMFWYNWSMTLLVLLIVPPFFILAFASTSILRRMSREIFSAGAAQSSYLIQSLTGIRSIRSMAIEQTVRWHWEELLNDSVKKSFRAEVVSNRIQIISGSIDTLMTTGLLWYGASLVINNQLTIGQLIAFNMLMGNVISPFKRLSVVWNQLQEIFISVERINDVLEAQPEEDLMSSPRKNLPALQGHIRFDNITFRYHSESEINILENISFEIQPEQMVAVVGRSGSGKTTLSKLILGLYPPSDGKVLIDGNDITDISLKSLRSQIGVVDQESFLFGGTIRENISIAHRDAPLEDIVEAASLAGAHEFIQQLPMGYETEIGEGGGMLSGGQRQRLTIARALLGNPQLLIFDEATSSLDAESERIIQNNLKTILKGRTSLIIAHRLSTVRNADKILVLDRGVLVESGTHEELINRKGHYYYLNQQQLAQAG
ncbi:ABC transporter transmembrane domain-containing protein [Mastigocoleus testarum]|uniref:ABC transporter ATP-binding protein n=1 Tax=Mastigocoleus testarum BC008 TaxID=371196 RepID=A0A0V7ZTB3_9CYAN|nr:ABC transporter transmembrane domain-containing protein [Mastigocoleus testarum]KST67736.1 ABC transporter ATP-binding protein [Mastigocoleus testarum BC008]